MMFLFREKVTGSQLIFFNVLSLLGGFDWGFLLSFFGWGNALVWGMYFVETVGASKVDVSFMNNEI